MTLLSEILSSRVREKIFEHLFDWQGVELHIRELERRSGCSIGTIQTELKKLSRLDLVKSRRDGNRLYFSANQDQPLYPEICGMVEKTVGLIGRLKAVFDNMIDVHCAFVFGSLAEGSGRALSDVDIMVIGDIGLRDLSPELTAISGFIGREINPHVISAAEFTKRATQKEHFIAAVLNSSKVFIKGGEGELGNLAG